MGNFRYFLTCASHLGNRERLRCPSCGCERTELVARKYLVTSLRRCERCALLFRTPTTSAVENASFYQESYRQGFTSDLPSDAVLSRLVATDFVGSERDYTDYLRLLSALGARSGQRLFDFGCSWGFGSWQLRRKGYEVVAYEISQPRCRFAREKLQISAFDDLSRIENGSCDIFFSAHVLEHVPSVAGALDLARNILKPGGLFVAITPNGSDAYRRREPREWNKLWSMVHPNFLDERFYRRTFSDVLLASTPYDFDSIRARWGGSNRATPILDGRELLAAVRMG